MAGTTTVTVQVQNTGGLAGQVNASSTWSNTNANEQVTTQTINGFAAVTVPTVPTTCAGVVIIPPPTNANSITLKGITGDTGLRISPSAETTIPFDSASVPSTIGVTTGASTVMTFRWI